MTAFRKPVFLNRDSYRRYMRALERCRPPPAGHYPVGYAISGEGAQRALRRRFPGADAVQDPGEPRECDDAFVFDIGAPP